MRVDAFDFELPPDRIALRPARPRESARLLLVGATLVDRCVAELPEILRPGDVIVVNDTRVLPAQLSGRRGEARIEVTLHESLAPGRWRGFAQPARRLAVGDEVRFAADFRAHVVSREGGAVVLDFHLDEAGFRRRLAEHGAMPLPPYIRRRRAVDEADRVDYQTVFAAEEGAVAAPTAGLHFTEALRAALARRGVQEVRLTLHVGAGTFLPVTAEDTEDHEMLPERGHLDAAAAHRLNAARTEGRRILAVGSTSLRLLESAADASGQVRPFAGSTALFLTPGYRFRVVDLMFTNFHLPRSTLFMLVAAFAGLERMHAAYAHAIAAGYRFYSYGDASLLERAQ